jgi:hypothetical protein
MSSGSNRQLPDSSVAARGRQQWREIFGLEKLERHWFADQVALHFVAVEQAKQAGLFFRFHPLRNHA